MSSAPFDLIDIVMRAGAGAGKTTELTERVLKLGEAFKKEGQYPHFVVTTFTRKATQELKERLLKKAMETKNQALVDFVQSPSHLHISTIHGVLSLFLAKYGSVIGLSPRISIISERRNRQILKKLIRDGCAQDPQFNEYFQNILENAEFSQVLGALKVTFDLQQQFSEARAANPEDFQKILQAKIKEIQKKLTEFVALSTMAEEKWLELRQAFERTLKAIAKSDMALETLQSLAENFPATRKSKNTPENWVELRDEIKRLLKQFEDNNLQEEFWSRHETLAQQFQFCAHRLNEQWLEEKLKTGEITMSDLESLTLNAIRRFPSAAEAFSRSWDYWLIDEYQDTSPAQVESLKALMGERKSFVVGDPQQSIYLFRGARSEVFDERERYVAASGGVLFPKMVNYRSEPELLLFFNHVFTGLGNQFRGMEPKKQPAEISKAVAEIIVIPTQEEEEVDFEQEAILFRIQELLRAGVPAEKICVLGKSHRELENLALQARELGIPVQLHTVGGLFDRREVLDAMALLKFLCNPHDNLNFLQLLRSPFFRIPDQDIANWVKKGSGSYWLYFCEKHPEHPILLALRSHLQKANKVGVGVVWVEQLIQSGYFLYAQKLDSTGRREANLWKLIHLIQSEEKKPGFSYLDFLQSQEAAGDTEEGDQSEAVPVIEPQRVHLMTIHASKGLEFHHVILPRVGSRGQTSKTEFFLADDQKGIWSIGITDAETGKMQASLFGRQVVETLVEREKREEDRRLYVALTRAEKGVTLIFEEDFDKDSWAAKLPLQLVDGIHQEKHFAYRVRRQAVRPSPLSSESRSQGSWREKYSEKETGSPWRIRSVTEILEGVTAPAVASAVAKREMADIEKALTGVAVHRLFENLKYQWLRNPDYNWRSLLAELPEKSQQALTYLMQDQQGLWQKIIQNGEVEFGFSALLGKSLVQGQIDLWGRDAQGQIWVVDYKTGSPLHQEKAFRQLEIYAWALAKMKKFDFLEKINLAVIYPFSEKTFIQEGPLSLQETENLIR